MGIFSAFRRNKKEDEYAEPQDDAYVELDSSIDDDTKYYVRPFHLDDFEDLKPILQVLREGRTIALVNIKPLKDRDIVELKRAINKLKKTTDAIEGEIAGFGDDYLVVTPAFARIYKNGEQAKSPAPAAPAATNNAAADDDDLETY